MRRSSSVLRRVLLGTLGVVSAALIVSPATGSEPVPGSAGTDTSLPATDSAVTVSGRGAFAGLEISVNQTANLTNQAVSITWRGGTPSTEGVTQWDGHYLQMMQCWGEDDGAIPENPGPPPEQCVQGAADAVHGGRLTAFGAGNYALSRVISATDWPNYHPGVGSLETDTGLVWRPFRAVDGTVVNEFVDSDFSPIVAGGQYWLNPYFNVITTNEIPGGRTLSDGTGSELFEVTTGLESTGLGCGQRVEPVAGGSPKVPRCWLVIVPRGEPDAENAGRPVPPGLFPVATSPVAPAAWQHRIAIPLEFNPVDTPCALSDEQRRIAGTELLVAAVANWQPKLCAVPGLHPYAYGVVGDATARQQLLSGVAGGAGMIAISRPYDGSTLDHSNPVVYAPLTASGTVIGFNVERIPVPGAEPAEARLRGTRVANLNLTPRLVAKLLTQSYRQQTAILGPSPHTWATGNPLHLGTDPDFLQFNPEFELLQTYNAKNFGGLVMPSQSSDAARQVWEWILADPEAKAWLDGAPDEWGMKVNPVYATTASANSTGLAFADPIPETFPKSDPYCYQGPPRGPGESVIPPLLCGTDWLPYTQGLRDAARLTRAATDASRTALDPFAVSSDKVYRLEVPQTLGTRAMLSLTDTPSASQYGVQTASLSRAGDSGPDRAFVAPDTAGLTAGVRSMVAAAEPAFLEPDPTADSDGAYPLTALTYAAVAPLSLDDAAREEYAAFIEYAVGPGQVPGRTLGSLPIGYAPLPPELVAQATTAATEIRELQPLPDPSDSTEPPSNAPVETPPSTPFEASPTAASASPSQGVARGASSGSQTPLVGSPVAVVQPTAGPSASSVEGPLLLTPILALARSRFVLPILGGIALLSALAALEITKRPRRALAPTAGPRAAAQVDA